MSQVLISDDEETIWSQISVEVDAKVKEYQEQQRTNYHLEDPCSPFPSTSPPPITNVHLIHKPPLSSSLGSTTATKSNVIIFVPDSPERAKKSCPTNSDSSKRIDLTQNNVTFKEPPHKKAKIVEFNISQSSQPSQKRSLLDEGTSCPICFEAWNNTGAHRICCLKCGHLFGKSCIEKWLKSQKKCPSCNTKASKTDVRVLYISKISVADTHELDFTLKQLKREQRERTKAETDLSKAQKDLKSITEKYEKLKQDYAVLQASLYGNAELPSANLFDGSDFLAKDLNSTTTTTTTSTSITSKEEVVKLAAPLDLPLPKMCTFFPQKSTIDYTFIPPTQSFLVNHKYELIRQYTAEGARVMNWSAQHGILAHSCSRGMNHGITKISAADPDSSAEYFEVHTKPIRDLKFSPRNDGIVLTTSMDKTLKLTSINTKNIVLSYNLETPSQACAWNQDDPNYLFCGQNKGILMFDIRKTNTYMLRLNAIHPLPIHTLSFVPANSKIGPGLLSGSPAGVCFWNAKESYSCMQLPFQGVCTSLSQDQTSDYFMSGFRSTPTFSKPTYTVFQFKSSFNDIKEIRTLHGLSPSELLTRSIVFSMSTEHTPNPSPTMKRLVVAAGDEKLCQALLWDAHQGNLIQKLPAHSSPILDMNHFSDSSADFLTTLSDKQLHIFRLQ